MERRTEEAVDAVWKKIKGQRKTRIVKCFSPMTQGMSRSSNGDLQTPYITHSDSEVD